MKGKELALIFDVGTQATRALVFDTAGDLVFVAKQNGELYISDVLVGGYGTYLIFVLVRYLFFGKGKYEYDLSRFKQEGEAKPRAAEEAQAGGRDAERVKAPAGSGDAGGSAGAGGEEQGKGEGVGEKGSGE